MKHTRPLAVRLPLLLLTVACVLFCRLEETAACVTASTTLGYSGSSFFWDVLVSKSLYKLKFTYAFSRDMKVLLRGIANVTSVELHPNSTGLFNMYNYTIEDPSYTPDMVNKLIFDCDLPRVNRLLARLKRGRWSTYANLFPDSVYATIPLQLNPDGNVFPEVNTTVIEWIDCEQTVAISGYYVAWSDALMNDGVRAVIEAVIIDAVRRVLEIYTVNLTVDVISIGAQLPSIKRTSFGNGAGGLVVSLHIAQGMTELSQFAYTADQTASVLTLLNLTILDIIYATIPSAGPHPLPLFVVASRVDGPRYGLQCDSVCKGMILLALVCVFIMIVVGVVVLVYQLCECGRVDDKEGSHELADMSLDHESAEVSVGDDVLREGRLNPLFL